MNEVNIFVKENNQAIKDIQQMIIRHKNDFDNLELIKLMDSFFKITTYLTGVYNKEENKHLHDTLTGRVTNEE